jgi:hypothetical protein
MNDDPQQSAEFLLGRLANEQQTNRKLRTLLSRAADALEFYVDPEIGVEKAFIAELRKATQ